MPGFRSSAVRALAASVATLSSLALTAATADAAEIRVLEVSKESRRYFVASDSWVGAPVADVFDVLSDYDNFEEVSKAFVDSRFLERNEDGSGLVYTLLRGCILFLCKSIERVEQLELVAGEQIIATVIPERSDLPFSHAHWRLSEENGGTRILYELEMEPGFWVPPLIGPLAIKHALRKEGQIAIARIERAAAGQ